ncbi:MAG: glycosyl transferase family 1, partial [Gillisia sp.]
MRILFISVFGYHFFNWVLQLKGSGHEIYWLDVNDANTYVRKIDFVHQTVKWKNKWDYPGRQRVKKNFSILYRFIQRFNQREFVDVFQQKVDELQPDAIHCFEMFSSCTPILEIMKKHPQIKWIYTSWGTDLFYYQEDSERLKRTKAVFDRLDFLFTDCNRDYLTARKIGFKGKYLGTIPGGGGYDLKSSLSLLNKFQNRRTILVKGYQGKFGRCINVLKALKEIENEIGEYKIIVFGAPKEVFNFSDLPEFKEMSNLKVMGLIGRGEVLKLMGQSLIYIGNSISDGLPNTLLEAIVMESFPIQSNP